MFSLRDFRFYSGEYGGECVLGCSAVCFGRHLRPFRRCLLLPSCGQFEPPRRQPESIRLSDATSQKRVVLACFLFQVRFSSHGLFTNERAGLMLSPSVPLAPARNAVRCSVAGQLVPLHTETLLLSLSPGQPALRVAAGHNRRWVQAPSHVGLKYALLLPPPPPSPYISMAWWEMFPWFLHLS